MSDTENTTTVDEAGKEEAKVGDSTTVEPTVEEDKTEEVSDWKAEAEKWKALSKKNETRAKENLARVEEYKGLATKNSELASELAGMRATHSGLLKKSIAAEVGLPVDIAGRLSGETEEELREDAKTLAELLGAKTEEKGGFKPLSFQGKDTSSPKKVVFSTVDDYVKYSE